VPPQAFVRGAARQDSVLAEDSWTVQVQIEIVSQIEFSATPYPEWLRSG
jgi:hypothetical protein